MLRRASREEESQGYQSRKSEGSVRVTGVIERLEDSMDIQLADVVVHIDEALERERRTEIEEQLRAIDGVISVHNPDEKSHLAIVEYNPDKTTSGVILNTVTIQGVHAELVGL